MAASQWIPDVAFMEMKHPLIFKVTLKRFHGSVQLPHPPTAGTPSFHTHWAGVSRDPAGHALLEFFGITGSGSLH